MSTRRPRPPPRQASPSERGSHGGGVEVEVVAGVRRRRSAEDGELELLELQLHESGRLRQHRAVWVAPGRFGRGDRNVYATYPRRVRRRRSLMTLWSDRCLLDECPGRQLGALLARSGAWDFNAFSLDRLCGGTNLATLCTHLFQRHGLLVHFRLAPLSVWKFFAMVEQGYHSANPYHNGVHAADVTQAMHCFLRQDMLRMSLTPIEVSVPTSILVTSSC